LAGRGPPQFGLELGKVLFVLAAAEVVVDEVEEAVEGQVEGVYPFCCGPAVEYCPVVSRRPD